LAANHIGAQAAYGAVILSFLGGPYWGLAMAGGDGIYPFVSQHEVCVFEGGLPSSLSNISLKLGPFSICPQQLRIRRPFVLQGPNLRSLRNYQFKLFGE
jgi:hypothetical protein